MYYNNKYLLHQKFYDDTLSIIDNLDIIQQKVNSNVLSLHFNYRNDNDLLKLKIKTVKQLNNCSHYITCCQFFCQLCNSYFPCQLCHDELLESNFQDVHKIQFNNQIQCDKCKELQQYTIDTNQCTQCQSILFISICTDHFFSTTSKKLLTCCNVNNNYTQMCNICQQLINNTMKLITLECNHQFCINCYSVQKHQNCQNNDPENKCAVCQRQSDDIKICHNIQNIIYKCLMIESEIIQLNIGEKVINNLTPNQIQFINKYNNNNIELICQQAFQMIDEQDQKIVNHFKTKMITSKSSYKKVICDIFSISEEYYLHLIKALVYLTYKKYLNHEFKISLIEIAEAVKEVREVTRLGINSSF